MRRLRHDLRARIDPPTEQVRVCPTDSRTFGERVVIGARTVEVRADYWIAR